MTGAENEHELSSADAEFIDNAWAVHEASSPTEHEETILRAAKDIAAIWARVPWGELSIADKADSVREARAAFAVFSSLFPASPAPTLDVPEVVREWDERPAIAFRPDQEASIRCLHQWSEIGDRMRDELTRMAGLHKTADDLAWDMMRRAQAAESTLSEQATKIEGLEREIEIRKRNAERHRVCSGHSGKQPTDGECIMCFAERHEAVRNRLDAKRELDRWKEEAEATVAELRAEVERLTAELRGLRVSKE